MNIRVLLTNVKNTFDILKHFKNKKNILKKCLVEIERLKKLKSKNAGNNLSKSSFR